MFYFSIFQFDVFENTLRTESTDVTYSYLRNNDNYVLLMYSFPYSTNVFEYLPYAKGLKVNKISFCHHFIPTVYEIQHGI